MCVGHVGSSVRSIRVAIAVLSAHGENLRIHSNSLFKSFVAHVRFPRGGAVSKLACGTTVFVISPEQLSVLVNCLNCLGAVFFHSLASSVMSFSRDRIIKLAIVRLIRFADRLDGNRSIAIVNASGIYEELDDRGAAVVATSESSLPASFDILENQMQTKTS